MIDSPKLPRINPSAPYCDLHHRYHQWCTDGTKFCPVCRLERDEGLDLFNPEKTPSTESNNGRTTA